MGFDIKDWIMTVFGLIVIATTLPLALGYIAHLGDTYVVINGTSYLFSTLIDPALLTLLQVVIPLVVIISIIIGLLGKIRGDAINIHERYWTFNTSNAMSQLFSTNTYDSALGCQS